MGCQNINFKPLSLNARGIRSFDKRKSIFNWLFKSSADICFLQEKYSTPKVKNEWKKNSGKAKRSFPMELITAEAFLFSLKTS
mgnify:CR=1 FL=1